MTNSGTAVALGRTTESSGVPCRCAVCDAHLHDGARRLAIAHVRGTQTWTRCPACGSYSTAEAYDAVREVGHTRTRAWGYAEAAVALGEAKAPLFDAVLRILKGVLPPAATLLDVGCSFGNFLRRAEGAGYRVRGMDIVPEAVAHVRSLGIPCDCAASVADLPLSAEPEDIITVLDCNCYWPDHRRELRAIRARLRPGGLLVMRVVDTSWIVAIGFALSRVLPRFGRRLCARAVYDHRVSVPVRSLLMILQQEGFAVIHTSVRDAVPFERNPLHARLTYALGSVSWALGGPNLAPGMLLVARRNHDL